MKNDTSNVKTKIKHFLLTAKDDYIQWSLMTKFDCYSKIFDTKNVCLRFIWMFFFVIFTGFTGYFVAKNVIDFYDYETISKIEIINEKPMEFPTITICNANPYTTKEAEELIKKEKKLAEKEEKKKAAREFAIKKKEQEDAAKAKGN